jgi:DNA-binding protein H-NS
MSETESADARPARDQKMTLPAITAALDKLTVQDLDKLMEVAAQKRREKQDTIRAELLAEFKAKAADLGIPFESLMGGSADRASKKDRGGDSGKIAVKFRGPKGEEWAGRGRVPRWLETLEAEGKSRDQFAV